MDSMDNMDTTEFEPIDPASTPASAERRSGRARRLVTSVAAGAVLLGSGAGIGVALTGGASASTGGGSKGGSAGAAVASNLAGRCAKVQQRLSSNGHPTAASRVQAFCHNPLVRLALVGGEHGEVTLQTQQGPKTIAVERGTVQAVTSSSFTVVAKDGTTWTWELTSNTKMRDLPNTATAAKLSTGELVMVLGQVVNGVHDARLIGIHNAS
jgi:hypothetical protein